MRHCFLISGTVNKTDNTSSTVAIKPALTFLDQEAPSESLVLVPEVHRGRAAFEVHLSVRVEQLVELDFHAAQLLGGQESVLNGRDVLVRPWRSA
jgi:hypothetical protein